jgi:hypothetical protein
VCVSAHTACKEEPAAGIWVEEDDVVTETPRYNSLKGGRCQEGLKGFGTE